MSNKISQENLEKLRKMKLKNLKKLRIVEENHTERDISEENTKAENLKKWTIVEKLRKFKFIRKGSPAFHTRSYKIKIIYESIDDIPSHLKFEWKKHFAREMYHKIMKNKDASLVTKNELAKIYHNLCSK